MSFFLLQGFWKPFCFRQKPTAIESIQPEDLDRKSVGGQPAITTKFPEIADIASDFVKQNSFAAQIRRSSNTGSSAGVSVSQIR